MHLIKLRARMGAMGEKRLKGKLVFQTFEST